MHYVYPHGRIASYSYPYGRTAGPTTPRGSHDITHLGIMVSRGGSDMLSHVEALTYFLVRWPWQSALCGGPRTCARLLALAWCARVAVLACVLVW